MGRRATPPSGRYRMGMNPQARRTTARGRPTTASSGLARAVQSFLRRR